MARKSGWTEQRFFYRSEDGKKLAFEGYDAEVILNLRELDVKQRVRVAGISDLEIEDYLKQRKESARNYVIDILSAKWLSRDSDDKLILKTAEHYELGKTFQQIKDLAKQGRLSIEEMNVVIGHFTDDDGDWYCPEGFHTTQL